MESSSHCYKNEEEEQFHRDFLNGEISINGPVEVEEANGTTFFMMFAAAGFEVVVAECVKSGRASIFES